MFRRDCREGHAEAERMRAWIDAHRDRLIVERLPAYAPSSTL
jgi:hypothetical protein